MKIKQISLFLENRPGALSQPVKLLAQAGFNILTLSIADAQEFGILRLVVQDWERAQKLLEKNKFVVKLTDMVAIEMEDRPGGLAKILDAAEKASLNVEYMYAFSVKCENKSVLLFRFSQPDKAIAALKKQRINVLRCCDLAERFVQE